MMKCKRDIVLLALLFVTLSINAQTITVKITNIRNSNGNIAFYIFKDNTSFDQKKPCFEEIYPKTNLINELMIIELKFKPGVYGILVLDDENKDGEMKYNWLGIPREGYGFSNYYHTGIFKPSFEDFDFIVSEKAEIVQVKMKYFRKK